MPCTVAGCPDPHRASTANWNVGPLCADHYNAYASLYQNGAISNATIDIIDDMVKVHLLFRDNIPLCRTQLDTLEAELVAAQANAYPGDPRFGKPGVSYTKLSRALGYYEGRCWFPANRTMLTGILDQNAFYASQKRGFNKYPGAGAPHGDQTHRLQWHVLMRLMTNNFTTPVVNAGGWNHTPLGLHFEFVQGYGVGVDAWPKAMDSQSNPGWANPDNVHSQILGNSVGWPRIAGALERRSTKMSGPTVANLVAVNANPSARDMAIMNSYVAVRGGVRGLPIQSPAVEVEAVRMQIYTWEKYKAALPWFAVDPIKRLAKATYVHMLTGPDAALLRFSNSYDMRGRNFLQRQDAPDSRDIDTALVTASGGGMNQSYVYNHQDGARPAAAARW